MESSKLPAQAMSSPTWEEAPVSSQHLAVLTAALAIMMGDDPATHALKPLRIRETWPKSSPWRWLG
ncbi:MAG: hypothetical protein M0Z53_12670 [Thermaerobacter sp.]|nr:hypothetical protein [Thermaerobacter sp.]